MRYLALTTDYDGTLASNDRVSESTVRARTGWPYWLIADEAHHILPDTWSYAAAVLPQKLHDTILVTVHPNHVAPEIFTPIDVVVAIGHSPDKTLGEFAKATGRSIAWPVDLVHQADQVVVWFKENGQAPFAMQAQPGRAERIRHGIKDDYLADETERVERRTDLESWQTRLMIEELVNAHYTLPE